MERRKNRAAEMFSEVLSGVDRLEVAGKHSMTSERCRQQIGQYVYDASKTLELVGLNDQSKLLLFCLSSLKKKDQVQWPYHNWAVEIYRLVISGKVVECGKFTIPKSLTAAVNSEGLSWLDYY